MAKDPFWKEFIFEFLFKMKIDWLYRTLNRRKILILAYHGVTENKYEIAPWTLIHKDIFEKQMKYISSSYNVRPLKEVAEAISSKGSLPKRIAVITFDDGFKNNLYTALPILEKYRLPATIFVTGSYVGSSKILPLDEAYILILSYINKDNFSVNSLEIIQNYCEKFVDRLKRYPTKKQNDVLNNLREKLACNESDYDELLMKDCRIVSGEDLKSLIKSEWIDIGAHTASHEILTNIALEEATAEINLGKRILEENTGREINLFAFPNGASTDYNKDHIEILKRKGFVCSVTTMPTLNKFSTDPYQLGRLCVGPNPASCFPKFPLRVSGAIMSAGKLNKHG